MRDVRANGWTGRELERQINSQLYERLLLSNNKEAMLAVARKERIPERPREIIKDPMKLEFLGMERKASYYYPLRPLRGQLLQGGRQEDDKSLLPPSGEVGRRPDRGKKNAARAV